MPRKFKRVLRKGYGYSKSKPKPAEKHSYQSTLRDKDGDSMCNNDAECTDHEEEPVTVCNISIQTETTMISSDAEIQTTVSINPNHFHVDVGIQCAMGDGVDDKEIQTEISVNPNSLPVDISIQCDMLDDIERPDKENSLPDSLCTGNNDEKFFPLVQKNRGTFKDLSGMYDFIFKSE